MFTTGKRVKQGQFSCEKVGDLMDDWIENSKNLTERRWNRILSKCGAQVEQERKVPILNAPAMARRRRNIYVPSSPTKSSDE